MKSNSKFEARLTRASLGVSTKSRNKLFKEVYQNENFDKLANQVDEFIVEQRPLVWSLQYYRNGLLMKDEEIECLRSQTVKL